MYELELKGMRKTEKNREEAEDRWERMPYRKHASITVDVRRVHC